MKETLSKFDWLTALACPAMAWHGLRAAAQTAPREADRFRMEQGQEIGALARKLYPNGILVVRKDGKSPAQLTQELMADAGSETLFEATVLAAPFVAKADILRREKNGWHVMEVKSSFADTGDIDALVSDLAYTVMVYRRAGLSVVRASLVLTRKMPPWFADPHYGKFVNDRSLTQPEIDTLVSWVDGGANLTMCSVRLASPRHWTTPKSLRRGC